MDKRLLLLAAGAYLLNEQGEEEAPPALPPGYGYGPPTVPGGPPTIVPGGAPAAPGATGPLPQLDINAGTNPIRLEQAAGASAWRPELDYIEVLTPPAWGVVGCCRAWATAYPSVRQARSGGGTMFSPRGAPSSCGCKSPGQAGGRTWWMPVEQEARRGNVPAVEVAPDDARWRLAGEGAGRRVRMKGFVHDGIAWIVGGRNFESVFDADPNVVYVKSVLGRAAVDVRTMRPPRAWQVTYKGNPNVPSNPDPWAVAPWADWMAGRGQRGNTPLEADMAGGRIPWDFVGPVYRWAFEQLPIVTLPFQPKLFVPGGQR